jgi:hypothetical protein
VDNEGLWLASVFFLVVLVAAASGFTLLGGYFLRRWLSEPRLKPLWMLGISAVSLGAVCGLMYIYGEGYYTVLFLMLIWISATLTALVFLWRSRGIGRTRMVIAIALLGVAYPALLLQMPGLYHALR